MMSASSIVNMIEPHLTKEKKKQPNADESNHSPSSFLELIDNRTCNSGLDCPQRNVTHRKRSEVRISKRRRTALTMKHVKKDKKE
ncbi:Uncharacterized protein APZ42_028396 [Daphnia magna]|uniref:Uncharacterized protein n=1 Tax=Daphnia magna TaxID=35525 RepID=A0A164QS03_9CRUS|nr:Uncharacterized protein APZ42_028396 [Daphnia magna]